MMVFVTLKQASKKKSYLSDQAFDLTREIKTLKDLIEEVVIRNVTAYNDKKTDALITGFLTKNEIEDKAQDGKVGFGTKYSTGKQDVKKAVDNALLSFEDGIYRVFINDMEIGSLRTPVDLQENDRLTFIKLVMLAGGMWRFKDV